MDRDLLQLGQLSVNEVGSSFLRKTHASRYRAATHRHLPVCLEVLSNNLLHCRESTRQMAPPDHENSVVPAAGSRGVHVSLLDIYQFPHVQKEVQL